MLELLGRSRLRRPWRKSSRTKARDHRRRSTGEVGPRQPCPCGSGRRYKACHGAAGRRPAFVAAAVRGPAVASATWSRCASWCRPRPHRCTLQGPRPRPCCSARCCRWPRRRWSATSGEIWLGLQVQHSFGDPSRDLGRRAARRRWRPTEPGHRRPDRRRPATGPRLQDLVADEPLEVTVHDGFDFWLADVEDQDGIGGRARAGQRRRAPDRPADRASRRRTGQRRHQGAPALGDARARGRAARRARPAARGRQGRRSPRAPGSSGMFRAHGLLAPVWDLPVGTGAEALEEPADAVRRRPRRGAGRRPPDLTAEAALGPLRPGQPAGHASR